MFSDTNKGDSIPLHEIDEQKTNEAFLDCSHGEQMVNSSKNQLENKDNTRMGTQIDKTDTSVIGAGT